MHTAEEDVSIGHAQNWTCDFCSYVVPVTLVHSDFVNTAEYKLFLLLLLLLLLLLIYEFNPLQQTSSDS
jgi:hypothetical protein